LSATFVPNTSRNRSTFSTVVVARIMTGPPLLTMTYDLARW
jgi:hypothetical protein